MNYSVIDRLNDWGCDIKGTLERVMGDRDLFLRLLQSVIDEPAFEQLGIEIAEKQTKSAYSTAHMLKGLCANMGLLPLYYEIIRIVEPLRAGNCEGLEGYYRTLMERRDELIEIFNGD